MTCVSVAFERRKIGSEGMSAAKDRRKKLVESGRCGFCGAQRNQFKWLCDECARKHRERQRAAYVPGKRKRIRGKACYRVVPDAGAFKVLVQVDGRSPRLSSRHA